VVIAGTQPLRRVGALVVTAAAALVLGPVPAALAQTSGVEQQATLRPADLIPDASWQGRPIKRPDSRPIQVRQPVGSTVIREGAGSGRPSGSAAVREVQRRLHALGYRTGPVDGIFGPRTRSSVGWFQIKHRLRPTGVVDGSTLNALRFRTAAIAAVAAPASSPAPHGDPAPRVARPVHPAPAAVPRPLDPAPATVPRPLHPAPATVPRPDAGPAAAPRPNADREPSEVGLPLLLVALAAALVAVATLATWLREGARLPDGAQLRRLLPNPARTARVPARPTASGRGRPPGRAVAAHTNGHGRQVIGYALGRDERDCARQQRAMQRVCGERGWTLSAVIKEREVRGRKRQRRPGLARVLRQVAAGGVGQLVIGRLHSLASTPGELAVLLEWCRRREVGLIALDVGLDTTTADGRLAARCLGAVGHDAVRAGGVR
jgi:peptidoglycan hydrolase-like protein with peptidoglycan-binding domain